MRRPHGHHYRSWPLRGKASVLCNMVCVCALRGASREPRYRFRCMRARMCCAAGVRFGCTTRPREPRCRSSAAPLYLACAREGERSPCFLGFCVSRSRRSWFWNQEQRWSLICEPGAPSSNLGSAPPPEAKPRHRGAADERERGPRGAPRTPGTCSSLHNTRSSSPQRDDLVICEQCGPCNERAVAKLLPSRGLHETSCRQ